MAALDIRTLAAKLDVGPVSAIHLIKGFIDGIEVRQDLKPYYGPMFSRLVESLLSEIPAPSGDDLEADPSPQTPQPQAPAEAIRPPQVDGGDQIKHMVDRFLSWRLPRNFNPDGGISFKAAFNECTAHEGRHSPTGTNLLDAAQAEAMVRHMIDGVPASRDRGELVAAYTTAMLTIADVRKALQPYVKLAIATRARNETSILGITFDAEKGEYVSATVGDLRALMRAAGLWAAEMESPAPDAEPAEKPEAVDPPPPAEGDDCPVDDPDCMGGEGDCHDACERPS